MHYVSLILAILFWSSSFIAAKIAYASFSPLLVCMLRLAIASVSMSMIGIFRKRKRPAKNDLKYIVLSAVAGITVYYAVENIGLSLTTAANASLIGASYPVMTVLVGMAVYRMRISKRTMLGIVMAIVGVYILTAKSTDTVEGAWRGDVLLILDGFLWGFYNFLTQSISDQCDTFTVSWYQMMTGALFFIPLLFLQKPIVQDISIASIVAILYLSVGCTVVATVLYNYGLRGVSAKTAVVLMNLMPVFGLFFSATILHETVLLKQIFGGAIVLLGVFFSGGSGEV